MSCVEVGAAFEMKQAVKTMGTVTGKCEPQCQCVGSGGLEVSLLGVCFFPEMLECFSYRYKQNLSGL